MKPAKTVVLQGEDGIDPHMLLLDGRDIRSVNRQERRRHGFRGPAFEGGAPSLVRFIRRHADSLGANPVTRRQRKVRARIRRLATARGLS